MSFKPRTVYSTCNRLFLILKWFNSALRFSDAKKIASFKSIYNRISVSRMTIWVRMKVSIRMYRLVTLWWPERPSSNWVSHSSTTGGKTPVPLWILNWEAKQWTFHLRNKVKSKVYIRIRRVPQFTKPENRRLVVFQYQITDYCNEGPKTLSYEGVIRS